MSVFAANIKEPVLMTWNQAGDYVDGNYIPGAPTSAVIKASVQRLTLAERQLLPEGFRSSESYKLYTEEPFVQTLINGSLLDAAQFSFKGQLFKMLGWEKWDYLIPHYKITVVGNRGG